MLLIKQATVYAPHYVGLQDILIGGGKILAMDATLPDHPAITQVIDANGQYVVPGFIDQHIHITGAGGKHGFHSMTPELTVDELIACGTTTVVGLLGTDGKTRSIHTLYAKVKALESEGISAYMYSGYYGLDPVYLMPTIQDDMIFIDKVLGCKIAISDIRSSYPTDLELLRLLRQIMVGGMLAGKKGILHLHIGNLPTRLDPLFRIVEEHGFPIRHISPTHVARTKELFEDAIRFALLGGSIDITTGASKYTDPYKAVLYALEKGVPMDRITFSTDGNAGLDRKDAKGRVVGFNRAPIDANLQQVTALIKNGGLDPSQALQVVTTNPANNLGLSTKGTLAVGYDADLCFFDTDWQLTDVVAKGRHVLQNNISVNP